MTTPSPELLDLEHHARAAIDANGRLLAALRGVDLDEVLTAEQAGVAATLVRRSAWAALHAASVLAARAGRP